MENPIKMDDLGVPPLSETPIYPSPSRSMAENFGGSLQDYAKTSAARDAARHRARWCTAQLGKRQRSWGA